MNSAPRNVSAHLTMGADLGLLFLVVLLLLFWNKVTGARNVTLVVLWIDKTTGVIMLKS